MSPEAKIDLSQMYRWPLIDIEPSIQLMMKRRFRKDQFVILIGGNARVGYGSETGVANGKTRCGKTSSDQEDKWQVVCEGCD